MSAVRPREWFPLPNGGWKLVDEAGKVLDTLEVDRASMQYQDSRGLLLGRKWEEARDACEARAGKVKAASDGRGRHIGR